MNKRKTSVHPPLYFFLSLHLHVDCCQCFGFYFLLFNSTSCAHGTELRPFVPKFCFCNDMLIDCNLYFLFQRLCLPFFFQNFCHSYFKQNSIYHSSGPNLCYCFCQLHYKMLHAIFLSCPTSKMKAKNVSFFLFSWITYTEYRPIYIGEVYTPRNFTIQISVEG